MTPGGQEGITQYFDINKLAGDWQSGITVYLSSYINLPPPPPINITYVRINREIRVRMCSQVFIYLCCSGLYD